MFRLLIVPYLIIEAFTTYYFVSANGFAAYAVEIVISAILGGYVVANRSWMGFFNLMKISPKEILSGVGFVVGGVFLIAPGIFGDILGVCIITASFYCVTSDVPKFNTGSENSEKSERKFWRRHRANDDVIDVEVIEENEIEIRKSIGGGKMRNLIIATRGSVLALWQSEHIASLLNARGIQAQLKSMKTKGDKILDTPLAKIGGKGLFTKELEESMLRGEAHIAVHSLKDVPVEFPQGLVLAAICAREDARDAMISEKYAKFDELPRGAKVGTTSLRRKMQLLSMRPDLEIISLRGNVQTRMRKLKDGEFNAIILAMAGINRLNLRAEVRHVAPFEVSQMIPAMGQGALGIEAVDEPQILRAIEFLKDERAIIETTVERDFVRVLEGGCQVPIGINARLDGENIHINAIVGLPDGSESIRQSIVAQKSQYQSVGAELARVFIEKGAKQLLARAEEMASL